jgi:hypothetical protein
MLGSAPRIIAAMVVAGIGLYGSVRLGTYAEADDAPGGVVIAGLLMLASVALGIWIASRGARKPAPK